LSRLSESPNRSDREYTAETERWSSEAIAPTVWPETAIDFSRSSSAMSNFWKREDDGSLFSNPLEQNGTLAGAAALLPCQCPCNDGLKFNLSAKGYRTAAPNP
jgi:hypothetical protein